MANESENVKSDVEELRAAMDKLTKDVAALSNALGKEMKSRASRTAETIGENAESVVDQVGTKTRQSAEAVENTIRERPFQSLVVAFGAGLLLSQLIRRR